MIYLKEFKFWDKLFNRSRKEQSWEDIAVDIFNYIIDNDIFIRRYDGFLIVHNITHNSIYIKSITYYSDSRVHIEYTKNRQRDPIQKILLEYSDKTSVLYKPLFDCVKQQQFKWKAYLSMSKSLGISDRNYIWEMMNKYNSEYSFFKYPNIVSLFRVKEVLEHELNFSEILIKNVTTKLKSTEGLKIKD